MIQRKKLGKFFAKRGEKLASMKLLGIGTHGSAYLLDVRKGGKSRKLVIKSLYGTSLGHSHFSDRAQVLLLANDTYNRLPNHVKAVDVIADSPRGYVTVGDAKEFLFLMEEAKGTSYFSDLGALLKKERADDIDIERGKAIARYLAKIHTRKKHDKNLYRRKIRDTIGHGECLMGVLDMYEKVPFMSFPEILSVTKLSLDHWIRMRDFRRLARIHGDFYQGNILFDGKKMTVMDRSRGEFGEPADDVTAMTINYIWYALMAKGKMDGAVKEVYDAFWTEYLRLTRDKKILECVQPFYAFRMVVVCNPLFYPDVPNAVRRKIVKFTLNVLRTKKFDWRKVNSYLK